MNTDRDSLSKDLIIVNELGMHARSAAKIAGIAITATSGVWIEKDGEQVDAKSVIDILTLACPKGSQITVSISEKIDRDILNKIADLVENGFGEDEE